MTKKLIGITGGIGAGKSEIARVFDSLGVPVYDADVHAKRLMNESENLRSAIQILFGEKSFKKDELDRTYIASKAFHAPKLLEKLNTLVHPIVRADFEHWSFQQSAPYVLKEAALLFETGGYKQLDQVILVVANDEIRLQRVQKRDIHRSEKDIRAIMKRQWSDDQKRQLADHILENDNSQMILAQILQLHQKFISLD